MAIEKKTPAKKAPAKKAVAKKAAPKKAAKKAGEGSEGGSIWACLVNDKAAELTKERTYVLLNILLEAAGREPVTAQ